MNKSNVLKLAISAAVAVGLAGVAAAATPSNGASAPAPLVTSSAPFSAPSFTSGNGTPSAGNVFFALATGTATTTTDGAVITPNMYTGETSVYTVTQTCNTLTNKCNPSTQSSTTNTFASKVASYNVSMKGTTIGSLDFANASYALTLPPTTGYVLNANLNATGSLISSYTEGSNTTSSVISTTTSGNLKTTVTQYTTTSCTANCSGTFATNSAAGSANYVSLTGSLAASGSPTATYGSGSLPAGASWTAPTSQTLYVAPLANATVDSSHNALGFTTGTSANNIAGWVKNAGLSTATESLWLYALTGTASTNSGTVTAINTGNTVWNNFLNEIATGVNTGNTAVTAYNIGSIATVPVPAPAILMLSGLAGLVGFARSRKARSQV